MTEMYSYKHGLQEKSSQFFEENCGDCSVVKVATNLKQICLYKRENKIEQITSWHHPLVDHMPFLPFLTPIIFKQNSIYNVETVKNENMFDFKLSVRFRINQLPKNNPQHLKYWHTGMSIGKTLCIQDFNIYQTVEHFNFDCELENFSEYKSILEGVGKSDETQVDFGYGFQIVSGDERRMINEMMLVINNHLEKLL